MSQELDLFRKIQEKRANKTPQYKPKYNTGQDLSDSISKNDFLTESAYENMLQQYYNNENTIYKIQGEIRSTNLKLRENTESHHIKDIQAKIDKVKERLQKKRILVNTLKFQGKKKGNKVRRESKNQEHIDILFSETVRYIFQRVVFN